MDVGGAKGKKGRHRPEMNVTPLVDVVLVLLIIFMVIAPALSKQFGVHIPNEPKDAAPSSSGDTPLVVSVNKEGEFRINKEVILDDDFSRRLQRALAARGDRKVFFDADDDAEYGRAVKALDLARSGGAASIAVMTSAAKN